MATTSSGVQQLYADIIADLIPYYMDAVLLPNQEIIRNSLVVAGSTGSQVRFPLTNAYVNAGTIANEGDPINAASNISDFTPTSANVSFAKRGVATDVSEESFNNSEANRSNSIRKTGEFRGSLSAKAYGNPEPSLINTMIRKVQRLSHMGVGSSDPKRLSPAYAG